MTISRTICLGFIAVILTGTLLLMMPFSTVNPQPDNILVALFTSTSAVCVTGLSVVDPGTYFTFWGQLFIALLAQVGGLGYMTVTTFLMLLIGRKFDFSQKLAIQESFDRPFLQGSQSLIKSILATTLIFEFTAAVLMYPIFAQKYSALYALWLAIFHSVSAWNNAGFSLFKDNLIGYQSSIVINLAITGLIIFGGIGYQVIIEVYAWFTQRFQEKRKGFLFSLNFKVVVSTTIVLLILGTLAFLHTESANPDTLANLSLKDKLLTAWFQSVTTRTAGFNSIDIGKMSTEGLLITMALMFVGASPSGTGGGIKTTTFRILMVCTRSVLKGQEEVILYQRKVPLNLILKAIAVLFGSAVTVIVATLLISFQEDNFQMIQLFFEVVSAFGTVGLSMGVTANLSVISKLMIILTMYIGRVGVILLIAAIIGDPKPSVINYPEENLLVG
ncbi:MAG: Ktr system potassium uptake protein B [Chroococcopsis gigantea SAG 12.99]|jgi:trk system potassium uptake protein TrkH|nr:TrkH family potassium uptake protein [Chlorogloea purpurea SAG 13.99]MDV3000399.1 Ktr system potassium uptake protein B [Chroococcopsis gigantea SAG 12.99]